MLRAGPEHKSSVITPRVWPEKEGLVSEGVLRRVDKSPDQPPTAGTPGHPVGAVGGTPRSPRMGPPQTQSQTAPGGSNGEPQQDTPVETE